MAEPAMSILSSHAEERLTDATSRASRVRAAAHRRLSYPHAITWRKLSVRRDKIGRFMSLALDPAR